MKKIIFILISALFAYSWFAAYKPENIYAYSTNSQNKIAQIENGYAIDEKNSNYDDYYEKTYDDYDKTLTVADPLMFLNRAFFYLNDKLYFWFFNPVGRHYKAIVPMPVIKGFKNFFANLITPIRGVNCLLQGKFNNAGNEILRFIVNTTVGVLGFGDPAKEHLKIETSDEDFGQTLAKYGIGNGFFLVLPVLGPITLRDIIGIGADTFLNPVAYVRPIEVAVGISGFKSLNNTSLYIEDYDTLIESAIEPYEALKDAYLQLRMKKIEE
mmetsp:Transcript_3234/g.1920  ORF Transcript_3234/g.1920 Transcript_3234/m.1920 type:complete len:269 (-) Transcript_3234:1088-1894(-)